MPSVAVSVTVWVVATVPAMALNVVEPDEPGTSTEAGTGNAVVLLDASVTVLPPEGAGWFNVTVHVVDVPPAAMLAGLHTSEPTRGPLGVTVTVVVVLPPRVAVRVTVCDVATEPAVAVNVAELVVAGTTTEAGTGSAAVSVEASVTVLPPAGAA